MDINPRIKVLTAEEISQIKTIDSKRISEVFKECLFRDEELELAKKNDGSFDTACVLGSLVVGSIPVFCWLRILGFKDEIKAYLNLLPDEFKESSGGGYTFLNMCVDKNNNQWGGQRQCDELTALGKALGLCDYLLPRQYWGTLPGSVPYIIVFDKSLKDVDSANLPTLQSLLKEHRK